MVLHTDTVTAVTSRSTGGTGDLVDLIIAKAQPPNAYLASVDFPSSKRNANLLTHPNDPIAPPCGMYVACSMWHVACVYIPVDLHALEYV